MTLLCITNQMDDFRSCTIRGEHKVSCDGYRYRWDERRRKWEVLGECTGCLGRLAKVGLLCIACYEKVQHAFVEWTPAREAAMGSIDRAVKRDTAGRTSGPEGYVPIPGTILAVNEISSYLGSFPGRLDLWVSSERGAMDAVRFGRAVPAALRTHELEEKQHKVRRTRCPECKQLALVWKPPAEPTAPVRVVCTACAHELPQDAFEKVAAIEKPETAAIDGVLVEAGQAVNRRGYFAEDYDGRRPEHEPLDPLEALTRAELAPMAEALGVERHTGLRKPELIAAIRFAQVTVADAAVQEVTE
ncbi:Rho termination factor N-terminal domain-containing protein [Leifsonia sp. NPDC014704]|uniref:Rho termination factor N-terminal domain-containing protein n=1 Tax=Leifsonia sp. NPDC014704 TaxID=3364123 RepID=UPI0036F44F65